MGTTYKKTTNENDIGIGASNTIILQTLMSTAYKKAEVENHYKENNPTSPSLLVYNVGVDLAEYYERYGYDSYNEACIPVMDAILNPAKFFKGNYDSSVLGYGPKNPQDMDSTKKNKYFAEYSKKVTTAYSAWQQWVQSDSTVTITNAIGTRNFAQLPADSVITKNDIIRNINYVPSNNSINIDSDQIQKTLEEIFASAISYNDSYIPIKEQLGTDSQLSYVDPIGEYMEVKDVKKLLLYGKEYNIIRDEKKDDENKKYYTVVGQDNLDKTIENPNYSNNVQFNLSSIIIWIENSSSTEKETLHIEIPKQALPIKTNSVLIDSDGSILEYKYNKNDGELPLRIIYTVELKNNILTTNSNIDMDQISENYKEQYETEIDGKKYLNFYSNYYNSTTYTQFDKTTENAYITYSPSERNNFYIYQENSILYDENANSEGILKNSGGNIELSNAVTNLENIDKEKTYYIIKTYYSLDEEGKAQAIQYSTPCKGSDFYGADDECYLTYYDTVKKTEVNQPGENIVVATKIGTKKFADITKLSINKQNNETQTAKECNLPIYFDDDIEMKIIEYVGNNGRLLISEEPEVEEPPEENIVTPEENIVIPDQNLVTPGENTVIPDENPVTPNTPNKPPIVSSEEDPNTAKGVLPQTGETSKLKFALLITIIIMIFSYIGYRKFKYL